VVDASEEETELIRSLRRQVSSLSAALVDSKIELDFLKAELKRRVNGEADVADSVSDDAASIRGKEYRILDVNKELGMVILNGGRRDGVKPGLMFDVINEDKSLTTVRVVDSRSAIAGAVIQNMSRGLPKVQDRAVLRAGSKN